ncbi:MAG: RNA-directed polymerase [Candidatus Nomurabacteria bacterium]|nr:RNA-directed polymerase [Candidatus Nomurabacteria bacterium]
MFFHKYKDIISIENLLVTWDRFVRGKRHKTDVVRYQSRLSDNIVKLHGLLFSRKYEHGAYSAFNISDPKPRNIHKASVQDRLLHHLIYKELYPYFENRFIYDSYSCRENKGTHRALDRFKQFADKVSKNNIRTCYILKCDIKKFFASIDHEVLMNILKRHIEDPELHWLIRQVIKSFHTTRPGVGLPLGNLTSQLLVNIYMHEFDMFMKQELRVKYYIRYADDFAILSDDKTYLEEVLPKMEVFLNNRLKLLLHEHKVYIKTYGTGVDFLGWIHFPHHRQIRTTTKRKIITKLKWYPKPETISSYRGLLNHGNTHDLQKKIGLKS